MYDHDDETQPLGDQDLAVWDQEEYRRLVQALIEEEERIARGA
jgi:hypothetical protein